MFFVYILKSTKFKKLYIGVTNNFSERLKKHNKGLVKAAQPYPPSKYVYFKGYLSKREAYQREKIKTTRQCSESIKKTNKRYP